MTVGHQTDRELSMILDNSVMHEGEATGAVEVRVSISDRGLAMSGPAGVAYASGCRREAFGHGQKGCDRMGPVSCSELSECPWLAQDNPRRVVAPILKATETIKEDLPSVTGPRYADDAAHVFRLPLASGEP